MSLVFQAWDIIIFILQHDTSARISGKETGEKTPMWGKTADMALGNKQNVTWIRGTTPETTSLNPGDIDGGNWSYRMNEWICCIVLISDFRRQTWCDTLARPSPGGGNLSDVQETDRNRSEGSFSDTCKTKFTCKSSQSYLEELLFSSEVMAAASTNTAWFPW